MRRILAEDVLNIEDGLIWCRGKEREELTPILPGTEQWLRELTRGQTGKQSVILASRIRRGKREPLGEDGMSQLIARLYKRAGITGMTGHDLRRTFATLVTHASSDEFLAMRLLRDKIPGQSERYIYFPQDKLRDALLKYSPLRLIHQKETGSGPKPEPADISGGDGGESNSPAIHNNLPGQCNTCRLNKPSVTTYPNAPEPDPKDGPAKLSPCLLDHIVTPDKSVQHLSLTSTNQTSADPLELLPQLLDRLIEIGDLARGISRALGGNGHRADKAAEVIQRLMNERR